MTYNNSAVMVCQDLTKQYGPLYALANVNLEIPRGKIIGLLGPNGSGKTTLIKTAAGLLTPTNGKLLINGMEPGLETKKVVSYLPDKNYLNNSMRVKDLIAMFSDFYENFDKNKAYDMLSRLSLNPNDKLKTMSKGTKEKIQLILVMSRNADLYLLDEPIAGVDPAARDYILNTIITNYNENASVIISTHLIYDIECVLENVIFIANGQPILVSDVDTIREENGKSVNDLFREVFRC